MSGDQTKAMKNKFELLQAELADLKGQKAQINHRIKEVVNTIKGINVQLQKNIGSYVEVSDHAIVRYLERVKNMDIVALKKEIVPANIAKAMMMLTDGSFPISADFKIVVKNKTVITVLPNDQKTINK